MNRPFRATKAWQRLAAGMIWGGTWAGLPAAPVVSRLTPPSALFAYGDTSPPYIARFMPGQRFDLQVTVRPDEGQQITRVEFRVDDEPVPGAVTLEPATADGLPAGTAIGTRRVFSKMTPGVHSLAVLATQSDGATVSATGNFEIVPLTTTTGVKARNIILVIGDGMGIAHRTAARVMLNGISQGKALAPLAMDTLPVTGLVTTASLDSIVTDSAPGAAAYVNGNKTNNNQEGVFPDDTKDRFDNPRIESIGEYLARTQGKWLGIVTTADVSDATPAAFGAHTQDRTADTGIADQFFDEAVGKANLRVLLGGGRRWFLPNTTPGSGRNAEDDYRLPADLASGWGVTRGEVDPGRDLLQEFRDAGFTYAGTSTQLKAVPTDTRRLLGLFNLGNMNAALDKIQKRRGLSTVVDDFGFPDQPMLDEMTGAALNVLKQNAAGFVLLVEGALIDKQSHGMDTERWLHEVIELDRAVARAKAFAQAVPDTLVIVTADHETGGVNLIGASTVSQADLAQRVAAGGGVSTLRDQIVGTYSAAGFPHYRIVADGYPESADVNRRLLIGYAANGDRYENWQTNPKPIGAPGRAGSSLERGGAGGWLVTGQVPGTSAVHTGSDVPLSAFGAGEALFTGVMDNTDVFFRMMQAALSGVVPPVSVREAGTPGTNLVSANTSFTTPSLALAVSQRTASQRLINLSTRAFVGTGENVIVSGFVLIGSQTHKLLIRGIGPTLAGYGVTQVLQQPILTLRNGDGVVVAANANWELAENATAIRDAAAAVGGFALIGGARDAAVLVALPPGRYTAELAGAGGSVGVGLMEVYELP